MDLFRPAPFPFLLADDEVDGMGSSDSYSVSTNASEVGLPKRDRPAVEEEARRRGVEMGVFAWERMAK